MLFNQIFYEPDSINYELGAYLKEKFKDIPWNPIESHNSILEMQKKENKEFPNMKRNLIIGIRKTHKYVENHKISDFLVPYTSSGCTAMCLYCYLVCSYNKCAYLRLFVNREQMLERLVKQAAKSNIDLTFEIGSNSDLILENTITENLVWTIPKFAEKEKGYLTFPSKFNMVESLLSLEHKGRVIFRMSVNPEEIIRQIEIGTSPLVKRIEAVNKMCDAGYPIGILIAPVIMLENWKQLYSELLTQLNDLFSEKVKKNLMVEVIFMTYSFVHRSINNEAFPNAVELYEKDNMTGRGRGKYCYRKELKQDGELFIESEIKKKLPDARIIYIC